MLGLCAEGMNMMRVGLFGSFGRVSVTELLCGVKAGSIFRRKSSHFASSSSFTSKHSIRHVHLSAPIRMNESLEGPIFWKILEILADSTM